MSKLAPNFRGKVIKGRFYAFEQDIYDLWMNGLDGKVVVLNVKEFKKERTNDQNRYYWAVIIKLVSEETGYSEDETHDFLKSLFLKKQVDIKGKRYIIIKSSASLKTDEFSEYVEKCKQWASTELGLYIPEPNEII